MAALSKRARSIVDGFFMHQHDPASMTLTSTLLLEGLKNPANYDVWRQYVDRYRPLILAYGVRLGLKVADAEDVAQQVLAEFSQAYQAGKYDRERGRLREWLFGIARNQVSNHRRRAARGAAAFGGTDLFDQVPDDEKLSAVWDDEWRSAVMRECLGAVRAEVEPKTFEAFELFACKGLAATTVAAQLGMTQNAVFGAKRRVLRRARELLAQMEDNW